jgi:hypothetical protein
MIPSLAVHESAHCIASLVLGVGAIDRVTLDPPRTHFTAPDAWAYGGREVGSRPETELSDASRWRMAAIRLLAGVVAEAKFSGESFRVVFRRNGMDHQMVCAFLGGLASDSDARDALLRDLIHEARCLVVQHWSAILAVGRALSISHTLLGHEIERIIRRTEVAA